MHCWWKSACHAVSTAERGYGAREEERVAQEAGCFHDRAAVRAALEAASGCVAQVQPVWEVQAITRKVSSVLRPQQVHGCST